MSSQKTRPKKLSAAESKITLTHPDRVIYADQNITKRDVANYFSKVAKRMLPHVAGRPLSLLRCPAGAGKSCFFQKHPPQGLSSVVERIEVKEKEGTAIYLIVNDLDGLLAMVQFGVLEFHVWGAKSDDLEHPDRLVFDLDPDPTVKWQQITDAARWLRDVLESLGLQSFLKTTGGKGLHVVVPIRRTYNWGDVKRFTKAIADLLVQHQPRSFISKSSKAARRGKIFIDYLRNDHGATWVAPYSTRARVEASISMPIRWDDLPKLKSAHQVNIQNIGDYIEEDPAKTSCLSHVDPRKITSVYICG